MHKKIAILLLFIIGLIGIIGIIGIMVYIKPNVTDFSSIRRNADDLNSDLIYLDDNLVPLSDKSDTNTALRTEALKAYNLINEERVDAGLDALTWNNNLETASRVRAEEAAQNWSHTRPNGKPWYTVNSKIQGGENLAYGFDTAEDAVEGWMNSATHKDNILYPEFENCAISVYETDNGVYYWAQEFGY